MAAVSSIEWTDATWNPVRGCTKISPGCKNCYAETFAERFRGVTGHPYEQGFDLRLVQEKLEEPLCWKRPKMIFVNSMSDLFHDDITDSYILQFVTSIQKQCERSRVPFFFKQWGGVHKKRAGRVLEGRTWDELPQVPRALTPA